MFDGGYRRGVTQRAQAAYDIQIATYRQIVLSAFQDVENNLAAVRPLHPESAQENLAAQSSQWSIDLARFRYRGDVANYLDVITSETTALTNQATAIDILMRQLTFSVSVIRAVGGGWDARTIPAVRDSVLKKP